MKSKNFYAGGYNQPPTNLATALWQLGKGSVTAGQTVDAAGVVSFKVFSRGIMQTSETGTKLGYSGALAASIGKFGEQAAERLEFEMDTDAGVVWSDISPTDEFRKSVCSGVSTGHANIGSRGNWVLKTV